MIISVSFTACQYVHAVNYFKFKEVYRLEQGLNFIIYCNTYCPALSLYISYDIYNMPPRPGPGVELVAPSDRDCLYMKAHLTTHILIP